MKLSNLKEDQQYFTGQLSNINRQIAFAGIATVWIFKTGESGSYSVPIGLVLPAIFLITSLGLDLLQYIYSSISWTKILRIKEKQYSGDDEFTVPKIISNISYLVFFYPKVICTVVAYAILFVYLRSLLI